jgi:hypothetical protein
MKMKRQKNYRQLRSKSSARNRLSEIKSRTVVPGTRHSDATVNELNQGLFGEDAEKPAYGEPPEDRFDNTPLPDFQFDWDEEFFGTASPGSTGLTETIPLGFQSAGEEPAETENTEVNVETGFEMQEEITVVNIAEPVEPIPAATVETEPVQVKVEIVTATPVRFVSVKRQMALAAREAEKMRKPAEQKKAGTKKPETTKSGGKKEVIYNTAAKKADMGKGKKAGSFNYGLPAKLRQNATMSFAAESAGQKPETGNSAVPKKSGTPSLNVRHTPSFRSFVISTIQKLIEQKGFSGWEQELLSPEPETGIRQEPVDNEPGGGGITRWNNPLLASSSAGLGHTAGKIGKKSNSSLPGEKQPATRSSLARGKSKPAPKSYQLNAARFTLMEAMLNAKAVSGNMKMKW